MSQYACFQLFQTLIPRLSGDFEIFDGMHKVYQAEDSCAGCNPVCTVLNDNTLGLIIPRCAPIYPQQPRIKTFWRVSQFYG